jgi:sirohydrochlorin ferrochelatase
VLVDHGSREPAANAQLERIAGRLRRRLGMPVEVAHLSLAPPGIADAIEACAERGVREVVVVPYFLAPGRHTTRDVPELARAAAAKHGLRLRLAEPLGGHPGLIDALAARSRRARPVTAARRTAAREGSS